MSIFNKNQSELYLNYLVNNFLKLIDLGYQEDIEIIRKKIKKEETLNYIIENYPEFKSWKFYREIKMDGDISSNLILFNSVLQNTFECRDIDSFENGLCLLVSICNQTMYEWDLFLENLNQKIEFMGY